VTLFNFNAAPVSLALPLAPGRWHKVLDSSEARWQGPGGALPVEFDCSESMEVRLEPSSAVLLARLNQTPKKPAGAKLSR
jgi:hypothetical protein